MNLASQLSLLRLSSPALPVGAFSYSRGLEHAVELGHVHDAPSAGAWIGGVLEHGVTPLDAAVFVRLHRAHAAAEGDLARRWDRWLFAARESAELQQEEAHMGRALVRLLRDLDLPGADTLPRDSGFASAYAFACVRWAVALEPALGGFLWTIAEAQVSAAIRLVPLGQTDGQRILLQLQPIMQRCAERAQQLSDDELGSALPGLAMASMWHETQYSRLFRS